MVEQVENKKKIAENAQKKFENESKDYWIQVEKTLENLKCCQQRIENFYYQYNMYSGSFEKKGLNWFKDCDKIKEDIRKIKVRESELEKMLNKQLEKGKEDNECILKEIEKIQMENLEEKSKKLELVYFYEKRLNIFPNKKEKEKFLKEIEQKKFELKRISEDINVSFAIFKNDKNFLKEKDRTMKETAKRLQVI